MPATDNRFPITYDGVDPATILPSWNPFEYYPIKHISASIDLGAVSITRAQDEHPYIAGAAIGSVFFDSGIASGGFHIQQAAQTYNFSVARTIRSYSQGTTSYQYSYWATSRDGLIQPTVLVGDRPYNPNDFGGTGPVSGPLRGGGDEIYLEKEVLLMTKYSRGDGYTRLNMFVGGVSGVYWSTYRPQPITHWPSTNSTTIAARPSQAVSIPVTAWTSTTSPLGVPGIFNSRHYAYFAGHQYSSFDNKTTWAISRGNVGNQQEVWKVNGRKYFSRGYLDITAFIPVLNYYPANQYYIARYDGTSYQPEGLFTRSGQLGSPSSINGDQIQRARFCSLSQDGKWLLVSSEKNALAVSGSNMPYGMVNSCFLSKWKRVFIGAGLPGADAQGFAWREAVFDNSSLWASTGSVPFYPQQTGHPFSGIWELIQNREQWNDGVINNEGNWAAQSPVVGMASYFSPTPTNNAPNTPKAISQNALELYEGNAGPGPLGFGGQTIAVAVSNTGVVVEAKRPCNNYAKKHRIASVLIIGSDTEITLTEPAEDTTAETAFFDCDPGGSLPSGYGRIAGGLALGNFSASSNVGGVSGSGLGNVTIGSYTNTIQRITPTAGPIESTGQGIRCGSDYVDNGGNVVSSRPNESLNINEAPLSAAPPVFDFNPDPGTSIFSGGEWKTTLRTGTYEAYFTSPTKLLLRHYNLTTIGTNAYIITNGTSPATLKCNTSISSYLDDVIATVTIEGQQIVPSTTVQAETARYGCFGSSLAITADGETVAVASPSEGYSETSGEQPSAEGAVYLYKKLGANWQQVNRITVPRIIGYTGGESGYSPHVQFGSALAFSGSYLLVGSRQGVYAYEIQLNLLGKIITQEADVPQAGSPATFHKTTLQAELTYSATPEIICTIITKTSFDPSLSGGAVDLVESINTKALINSQLEVLKTLDILVAALTGTSINANLVFANKVTLGVTRLDQSSSLVAEAEMAVSIRTAVLTKAGFSGLISAETGLATEYKSKTGLSANAIMSRPILSAVAGGAELSVIDDLFRINPYLISASLGTSTFFVANLGYALIELTAQLNKSTSIGVSVAKLITLGTTDARQSSIFEAGRLGAATIGTLSQRWVKRSDLQNSDLTTSVEWVEGQPPQLD